MLVLQTSQPKRLYTEAETVFSRSWSSLTIPWNDITTACYWIDKTNKYIYVLRSKNSAPWLCCYRFTYDINWQLWSKTEMTLSGFGTFSSAPSLYIFQGSHSGNFYIACWATWWSANFTIRDICSVSVSGTTMTKGANLSVPTVGSYSVNRCFAVGSVVYVFYNLTASPYTMDVGRKYTWSWWTLSGAALPSSVQAYTHNGSNNFWNTMWEGNVYGSNVLWVWTSNDKFYNYFSWSDDNGIFDAATDTWSNSPYYFTRMFPDVSGQILLSAYNYTFTLWTSGTKNWFIPWILLPPVTAFVYSPIVDIDSWLFLWQHTTSNLIFYAYYKWTAKRLWKVYTSNISWWSSIMTRIDGWDWWWVALVSTSILMELDYFWETSIEFFILLWGASNNAYVEVTD